MRCADKNFTYHKNMLIYYSETIHHGHHHLCIKVEKIGGIQGIARNMWGHVSGGLKLT